MIYLQFVWDEGCGHTNSLWIRLKTPDLQSDRMLCFALTGLPQLYLKMAEKFRKSWYKEMQVHLKKREYREKV